MINMLNSCTNPSLSESSWATIWLLISIKLCHVCCWISSKLSLCFANHLIIKKSRILFYSKINMVLYTFRVFLNIIIMAKYDLFWTFTFSSNNKYRKLSITLKITSLSFLQASSKNEITYFFTSVDLSHWKGKISFHFNLE